MTNTDEIPKALKNKTLEDLPKALKNKDVEELSKNI